MKKCTRILKEHKYAISQGNDGYWRTYLPDEKKENHRRLLKRKTKEDLEDAVIAFYEQQHKQKGMTLESLYPEWLDYYSMHTAADGTMKHVTCDWKKYYEDDPITQVPIKELTKIQLDRWVHELVKDYQLTKTAYYNASLILRQMMQYALECGYIEENPFKDVHMDPKLFCKKKKPASETQVYTLEEEMMIIEEAWRDYESNPAITTPLAVILMFYLGVRVGEVVAFKESDIEGNEIHVNRMERRAYQKAGDTEYKQTGRIVVEHAKTAAGNRSIYLVEDARKVLDTILETNRKNGCSDSYLFLVDGERIDDVAVRWRLEKYCNKAGIPYRSPHKIRKTFISKLIDNGLSINMIREMVGHEDERTTFNSYCFNRKTKEQTRQDLEDALAITEGSNPVKMSCKESDIA